MKAPVPPSSRIRKKEGVGGTAGEAGGRDPSSMACKGRHVVRYFHVEIAFSCLFTWLILLVEYSVEFKCGSLFISLDRKIDLRK